ncbi:MAG: hypothetical protein ACRCT8_09025 [Lacipirellulaceae bacterium]
MTALVDAGAGVAEVVDPATSRVYLVVEQAAAVHPRELPLDGARLKAELDAAAEQIARGDICKLSAGEIVAEARRRRAERE